MSESFQHRFCRHFNVSAERFAEVMLQRTLYRRARWLRWFASYDAFSADRCFISSVGRLTRREDFLAEVREFRYDSRNQSFWRHTLRFRVSTQRMRALFREVWPESATVADNGAGARPQGGPGVLHPIAGGSSLG